MMLIQSQTRFLHYSSLITNHTDSLLAREILGPAIRSLRRNPDLTCEVCVTQGITLNEPGTISAQISPNAFEVPSASGLPSRRERPNAAGMTWFRDRVDGP